MKREAIHQTTLQRMRIQSLAFCLLTVGSATWMQPVAVVWAQPPKSASEDQPGAESNQAMFRVLSEFNRGSALMEQYQYSAAVKVFESVVNSMPDWPAAQFNLGLAYLNMQGSKDSDESLDTARETFQAVLERDPGNLNALFCLGMYYQHLGDNERAMVYFARVYLADPDDPYVGFRYAEALLASGSNAEGIEVLEKVVETDPGFVSAVYRLALQYRRTKGVEAAMPLLKRFQSLRSAEVAGGVFAVQKVYGTNGKYYQVLGADGHPLVRKPPSDARRIIFSPEVVEFAKVARRWSWASGSIGMPGLAVIDAEQDGDLDLFLTATGKDGVGKIWLNDGTGAFHAGANIAESSVTASVGDVDNDGDDDLWLGSAGAERLWENDGRGIFSPAEFSFPTDTDSLTALTRLIDIDSDGDLDLLAFRLASGSVPAGADGAAANSSIFNNNRDGSFAEMANELGLELSDMPVSSVVCDDLDNDRDLDIVVFSGADRQPVTWVNDRLGAYRILKASDIGLTTAGVVSAVTGDPDKDGDRDLLVFTRHSMRLFENLGRFRFRPHQAFGQRHGTLRATGGQFADMDNDGDLDLVLGDAHRNDGTRGPVLLVNNWPRDEFVDVTELDPGNLLSVITTDGDASCVVADFTNNGRCDVLLATKGHKPRLVKNITPGGHWITLDMRGTNGRDQMTRSNNSAIGARVEIKTGNIYQQFVVGGMSGPVAAPALRLHVGLGDFPKVDWLRVVWPDAVMQAEIEVAGDRAAKVVELSRKSSSCPYLYAWDGDRFNFIGDFGGVGGLGYLVAPGTYAPPDPTEYVPVPNLRPRNGSYVLNALTVLEEVTYFDEAKLIAVDHPVGTQVLPNEMMAINAPPPDFEVFCYRDPIEPVQAEDHRGVNVTSEISRIDRRYAGATRRDLRFAGIAEPHFVELDFGRRLSEVQSTDRLLLVAHGWVEYGYSSTNFAAAQAGLRTEAPSIAAFRDGHWVELFEEVGYPAGTQHVMTLDVTGKVLPTDRKLRISSNMDLYWDRVHLAVHDPSSRLRLKEVAAASADLHFFGFPREYSPDGHHPNLSDYENVDRNVAWKLMPGNYTRFGDVTELVGRSDDCFAIMGHGEELTLKFPVQAFGPVPDGQRRSFLLKTDSYCKDMDLYTAHPDTVEPLPFHAMSGYPYGSGEHYPDDREHTRYRHEYNTRQIRVESMPPASR